MIASHDHKLIGEGTRAGGSISKCALRHFDDITSADDDVTMPSLTALD